MKSDKMPKEVTWEVGDVLLDQYGDECVVLEVSKYLATVSKTNHFTHASSAQYTRDQLEEAGWKLKERDPKDMEQWLRNEDKVPFKDMPDDVQDAMKRLGKEGLQYLDCGEWIDCSPKSRFVLKATYHKKQPVEEFTVEHAELQLYKLLGHEVKII